MDKNIVPLATRPDEGEDVGGQELGSFAEKDKNNIVPFRIRLLSKYYHDRNYVAREKHNSLSEGKNSVPFAENIRNMPLMSIRIFYLFH